MQTSHHFSLKTVTRTDLASLIRRLGEGLAFVEGHLEIPVAGDWGSAEFARNSQLICRERQEPRLAQLHGSGDVNRDPAAPEELVGFYTGQLAPMKLRFDRAGEPMTVGALTIGSILEIAAHYVGLGYVGVLRIAARSNYGARDGVSPHLIQPPGSGAGPMVTIIMGNVDDLFDRPQVRIDHDQNDSSQTAIADRLISVCTEAKLERFEPERVRQAA